MNRIVLSQPLPFCPDVPILFLDSPDAHDTRFGLSRPDSWVAAGKPHAFVRHWERVINYTHLLIMEDFGYGRYSYLLVSAPTETEPDLYDFYIIDTTSQRPVVINISGTEYMLQLTDTNCYPYKVKVSSLTEIAEVEHGS